MAGYSVASTGQGQASSQGNSHLPEAKSQDGTLFPKGWTLRLLKLPDIAAGVSLSQNRYCSCQRIAAKTPSGKQSRETHVSLYNLIFGMNKNSDMLLGCLNLTKEDTGRFRDTYVTENGEEIAVFTRNGGGNRQCYFHKDDGWPVENTTGTDCGELGCYSCIIRHRLPKHPLYLRDEDDSHDSTYATIYFKIPEEMKDILKHLAEKRPNQKEMWEEAIAQIMAGKRPEVMASLKKTLQQVHENMDKSGSRVGVIDDEKVGK
jgi:hypothetical protein